MASDSHSSTTAQESPDKAPDKPTGVRVTAGKCPRCNQPVAPRFRPFCSERCSDLDLAGWLTGKYRIPTEEVADPHELAAASEEEERS